MDAISVICITGVLGICIVLIALIIAVAMCKDKHNHHHIHISDSQMLDEFINAIYKYAEKH